VATVSVATLPRGKDFRQSLPAVAVGMAIRAKVPCSPRTTIERANADFREMLLTIAA
jgi:hypothetical protein